MFRRIEGRNFISFYISKGNEYYKEHFILIDEEYARFASFPDYISFFELALAVLPLAKIPDDIKDYFGKLLSGVSSCRALYLGDDFKAASLDYEAYKAKIRNVFEHIFEGKVSIPEDRIKIIAAGEVVNETLTTYRWRSYPEESVYPESPLYNEYELDERANMRDYAFPEEFLRDFRRSLVGIVKKETGDFYTDLFKDIVREFQGLKLPKDVPDYSFPFITIVRTHVDVGNSVDYIIQAVIHLLNSSSFSIGSMQPYDVFEIEKEWNMLKRWAEDRYKKQNPYSLNVRVSFCHWLYFHIPSCPFAGIRCSSISISDKIHAYLPGA